MPSPRVSIMIVARDAAATLPRALASVYAQRCGDWECWIFDDGSRDATPALLGGLRDPRVRWRRVERPVGRGAARAALLEQLRARWIAPLDADDWMLPERVEAQLQLAERSPGAVLVASAMYVEDAAGRLRGVQAVDGGAARGALRRAPMSFAPSLLRADAARAVGFRPELRRSEDLPFLRGLLARGPWVVSDAPLYVYRPAPTTRAGLIAAQRAALASLRAERHGTACQRGSAQLGCFLRWGLHASLSEPLSTLMVELARARRLTAPQREHLHAYLDAKRELALCGQRARAEEGPR